MMLKRTIVATALTAGLAASLPVSAAPFGVYDPRSLGMGGVGVTTATARNANFFNPAMLAATRDDDNFALGLPIIAVRASDRDKLMDDIDALEASGNALADALRAFDTSPSLTDAGNAASALNAFDADLANVNNKVLDAGAFVGGIITIPSKKIGVGLHVSGRADLGAKLVYDNNDRANVVQPLRDSFAACRDSGNILSGACTTVAGDLNTNFDKDGDGNIDNDVLQSRILVRGIAIGEVGLAFARRFEELAGTDIGITAKAQRITTFDYAVTPQSSEIDTERGKKEESDLNFDVGVTKTYGDAFKAGLVIKNILAKEYTTKENNKIELKPQARLGVSHHRGWANVGIDVDLTKNKPVAAGFDKETQFAAIGAELDLFSTLQLRLGYRHDLAGNYDGMPSIGIGLSPFGIHIDAAVAGNSKEAAAAIQLGFNF
jgi:hypothetical protein